MPVQVLTAGDVAAAVATLNELRAKGAMLAAAGKVNSKEYLVCAQSAHGKIKREAAKPWHIARMTSGSLDLWGLGYRVAGGTSDYQRNGAIYGFARSYADAQIDIAGKSRTGINGRQRIVPGSLYVVPGYLIAKADLPRLEAALAVAYHAWVNPTRVIGGWPPQTADVSATATIVADAKSSDSEEVADGVVAVEVGKRATSN